MRVAVLIFCFFLLLQKSNSNAISAVHPAHMGVGKAFVLERKKTDTQSLLANSGNTVFNNGQKKVSQSLIWNYEEEDDIHFSDVKFKLICGFYVLLPSLYQTVLKYLSYNVTMHQHFSVQVLSGKYLIQRSLRIWFFFISFLWINSFTCCSILC